VICRRVKSNLAISTPLAWKPGSSISYMLGETMSDLSERMDPRRFVRVHRSVIVNLDSIREIYREGMAQGSIRLADGQVLKMSKAGRKRMLALGKI
jgi:two-component system, LytTR family, response regulator